MSIPVTGSSTSGAIHYFRAVILILILSATSGCSPDLFSPSSTGTIKWSFQANDGIAMGPAAYSDGTIYITSIDANLYALTSLGPMRWQYLTRQPLISAPAIDMDGNIYALSADDRLYSVDSEGVLRWYFDTESPWKPSLAIDDTGTCYLGSASGSFLAVDSNGTLKWEYSIAGSEWSQPAIGQDTIIYVGVFNVANGGDLIAFSSAGVVEWQYHFGDTYAFYPASPALAGDGSILITTDNGRLHSFDTEGNLNWTFIADSSVMSSICLDANDTIYFGAKPYIYSSDIPSEPLTMTSHLYALALDGSLIWKREVTGGMTSSPVVGQSGTLYVMLSDGGYWGEYLYAFSSHGVELWKRYFGRGEQMEDYLLIQKDGTLLLGSGRSGTLYALDVGNESPPDSWYKPRGNNRNSGTR